MTSNHKSREVPSSLSQSSLSLGGTPPVSNVLENGTRKPSNDTSDPCVFDVEAEAHKALALAPGEEFHVLDRLRSFEGAPRVLQTTYFNPSVVPSSELIARDFRIESLAKLYEQLGFDRLPSRPRRILSRVPTVGERNTFRSHMPLSILEVRQLTYARHPRSGAVVPLEYLYSRYLDWPYYLPAKPPLPAQWYEAPGS